MRKALCVFILIFGCLSLTTSNDPVPKTGDIVYITKTGTKYHAARCRFLNSSQISIERSTAKAKGYEACRVCKP